jgi:hypothetical protein
MYCIDTDSLINAWRFFYPIKNFPCFWFFLDQLIESSNIISPIEVFKELERGKDDLYEYMKVKKRNMMFKAPTIEVKNFFSNNLEAIYKNTILRKEDYFADPYVVSLAAVNNCVVITSENPATNNKGIILDRNLLVFEKSQKIPNICALFNLKYIKIYELPGQKNLRCLDDKFYKNSEIKKTENKNNLF